MPADRAFSTVEAPMKKFQTILDPQEYDRILEERGNLFKLGTDFPLRDHAKVADLHLKVIAQVYIRYFQFVPSCTTHFNL